MAESQTAASGEKTQSQESSGWGKKVWGGIKGGTKLFGKTVKGSYKAGSYVYERARTPSAETAHFYRRGAGEEWGRWKAHQQMVRQPLLTVILLAAIYYFFTNVFRLPILSDYFNIPLWPWYPLLAGFLYFILHRNILGAIIYIAIMPFLFYGASEDMRQTFELWADQLRDKFDFAAVSNPWDSVQSKLYKSYGEWKNPRSVEKIETKGVTIRFPTAAKVFKEHQPILLSSKVTVDGYKDTIDDDTYMDNIRIDFACYALTKNKTKTYGKTWAQNNPEKDFIIFPPKARGSYDVSCYFPKGLAIDQSKHDIFGKLGSTSGTEMGNRIVSKTKVFMEATTTFSQATSVKLWAVQHDNQPDDIYKAVSDPDLLQDGRSFPLCISGCGTPYRIGMTGGVQPITEEQVPLFELDIIKNPAVHGTLKHIRNIVVRTPADFGFSFDPSGFAGQLPCDFVSGELKETKIEEVNAALQRYNEQASKDEETFVPSLSFSCPYKLHNPPERLQFDKLHARVIYDASVSKWTLVEIYKDIETTSEAT